MCFDDMLESSMEPLQGTAAGPSEVLTVHDRGLNVFVEGLENAPFTTERSSTTAYQLIFSQTST
jgi:hypothetical protein